MFQLRKSFHLSVSAVAAAVLLAACGGGDGSMVSKTSDGYTVQGGIAQKGPMAAGSRVSIDELDYKNFASTGASYNLQTFGDLGNFNADALNFRSHYIKTYVSGYYLNEVSGLVANDQVSLMAFSDLDVDRLVNINLLTTLAGPRIEKLVRDPSNPATFRKFAAARAQAQREVLAAFRIYNSGTYLPGGLDATGQKIVPASFNEMDLASGQETSAMLAALSALAVQAGSNGQGGSSGSGINEFIADFQADLADNGQIDGSVPRTAVRKQIDDASKLVPMDKVASNLNTFFNTGGASPTQGASSPGPVSSSPTPGASSTASGPSMPSGGTTNVTKEVLMAWIDSSGGVDGVINRFKYNLPTAASGTETQSAANDAYAVGGGDVGQCITATAGKLYKGISKDFQPGPTNLVSGAVRAAAGDVFKIGLTGAVGPGAAGQTLGFIQRSTPVTTGTGSAAASSCSPNAPTTKVAMYSRANQQATVVAVSTPSSVATSGTTTLSSTGGNGNGAVTFAVKAGTCTISGTTLTAASSAGTCTVTATKAADTTWAAASSAELTITVTASSTSSSTSAIDFESTGRGAAFGWSTFENATNPAPLIVANPSKTGINTSDKVLKFTALKAGQPWAGFESQHGTDLGTVTLSASNALIKMMVYKTVKSDVGIKLITATDGSQGPVIAANTGTNTWELLTFNFCGQIGGVNDKVALFPEWSARTADTVTYLDNVTFNACPAAPVAAVPTTAPALPTAAVANVKSLYGDGYTTVAGTDTPNWGGTQTTSISTQTYAGNSVLKLANFNYQGVTTAALDVSSHTSLHIDFWSETATTIEVKLVSLSPTTKETSVFIPVSAGAWTSRDIPMSSFTAPDKSKFQQLILAAATNGGVLYVDNIYFWK